MAKEIYAMNYWMHVISPENYQLTKQNGFTIQGFRLANRKKVDRMAPGDRMLFYVDRHRRFSCTASITSHSFSDHRRIWQWVRDEEDFSNRVFMRPNVVLNSEFHVDAEQLAPRLDYVKRWVPEWWPLAFQGNLHLLPKTDFHLIESEMKRAKIKN